MTQALDYPPSYNPTLAEAQRRIVDFADEAVEDDLTAPLLRRGNIPYLLALRFAVFNMVAFALLGAAYLHGWVSIVLAADNTGLTAGIFVVFLGGFAVSAHKAVQISRELNAATDYDPRVKSWAAAYLAEIAGRDAGSRGMTASVLKARIASRIAVVRQIANSLVLLGLIGTVVGFIIALSGVDPDVVGDVHAISPMVTELIRGMSVALYTTLVGAVLNLWLVVNHHLLAGGAVKLVSSLVALGESHARH